MTSREMPAAPARDLPSRASPYRRLSDGGLEHLEILDQTRLPYQEHWLRLHCLDDAVHAITHMQARGAPLIGLLGAYGIALALWNDASDPALLSARARLSAARPTAAHLDNALNRICRRLTPLPAADRPKIAWREADAIAAEIAAECAAIGQHGLTLLRQWSEKRSGRPLQIMTHCNAGYLATPEYGTALAPVYAGLEAGIESHLWVSETRPRNQGLLTAWELARMGVPYTLTADNAAGLLLLQRRVDAVIVGADRIAANGDVVNKVGTSLKALAARRAGIPFYVAAPGETLDFSAKGGADILIENRDGEELRVTHGIGQTGEITAQRQIAENVAVYNPAFDITPAELVTGIITERGIAAASAADLARMFPDAAAGESA
ncbi:MAG: S-methyl-5-thioribose-1-phosphate isomerase [Zoogloeaceae bacterium]|jgi:methylthioribose-1-phosphate isomerase|nr:S-methyl-5-thioribose-1-phosphate isomerase [Zoogloeaceae bacterium]